MSLNSAEVNTEQAYMCSFYLELLADQSNYKRDNKTLNTLINHIRINKEQSYAN